MLIGLDIDGVMTMYEQYMKEKGQLYFNSPIIKENGYDVDEIFGVSKQEAEQFWVKHNEDYLLNCPVRDDLYFFSKAMYLLGHQIVIITNRLNDLDGLDEQTTRKYTEDFLKKNLYKYEDIYYSLNNKADIANQLQLDCMVEDSLKFIKEISSVCPVIYPETSYNKSIYFCNDYKNTYMIRSFTDAINLIDVLNEATKYCNENNIDKKSTWTLEDIHVIYKKAERKNFEEKDEVQDYEQE